MKVEDASNINDVTPNFVELRPELWTEYESICHLSAELETNRDTVR